MRRAWTENPGRSQPSAADIEPRRIVPNAGVGLTVDDIDGDWRPSGSILGYGMFAVVWYRNGRTYWAALHDFERPDREQLIEMCRCLDRNASGGGVTPPRGR